MALTTDEKNYIWGVKADAKSNEDQYWIVRAEKAKKTGFVSAETSEDLIFDLLKA